jgi:xanthine dehydrogenase accessory factor
LILENGTLIGTIGGGLLEAQTLRSAKEVISSGTSRRIHYSMRGSEVARTDMLCGGEVDIFLELISPADIGLLALYREVVRCHDQGIPGIIATEIPPNQCPPTSGAKFFVTREGGITQKQPDEKVPFYLSPERIAEILERGRPLLLPREDLANDMDVFLEPVVFDPLLYIFGAGHVSRDLAPIASRVGFQVVVIDDREDFATPEHFPEAREVCLHPFDTAMEDLPVDENSYLVIVTRGHLHDKVVLAQSLKTRARYIGMIGSKRKRDMIYKALLEEGVPQEDISRVHSPIGIEIGAETPAEIAVSIVAELIRVRAEKARVG